MTTNKPKPQEGVQDASEFSKHCIEPLPDYNDRRALELVGQAKQFASDNPSGAEQGTGDVRQVTPVVPQATPVYVPDYGISDITARVDASQTPVNVANDAFGACMIRVAMLEGQLAAEKDRLCELAAQLKMATDEAVKQVTKGE